MKKIKGGKDSGQLELPLSGEVHFQFRVLLGLLKGWLPPLRVRNPLGCVLESLTIPTPGEMLKSARKWVEN